MATTRLGLYGGPRSPYGSFAGKVTEIVIPPADVAVQFGKTFYAGETSYRKRQQLTRQLHQEDAEILALVNIVGKFLL